ncbi:MULTISPECIES: PorP/SprF family type IX secretion system membrane protein [unclassified Tenacibaculum]|uniref:PorP/SprF family type IX secretion system membrane protein n=1 Tax=unclassified Tenacibaculum TaxID=2635139 RepID=UPI001F3F9174|nr:MULTISPECIES: PorP/SprF family type IX secretion system membrane protein [unclassified Tenacibaculum]MCF2876339.1 PorP/SprF family type IX secretion system membrane protein [Tenacibaculum sp. Cn5-1]MCF2936518.1 PorP/SprF family type IX secretion system membrane protein [Tenacibaculum sp. Cn5-34]MCG7512757.1 PorP/SprF family type IX secretion system membrane protein [Tenacibaculum sp. Cn5-46]
MIKKYIVYMLLLVTTFSLEAQVSNSAQQYNSFTSRNFMKFNRFLTVPTFSALRENKTSITAIVRNSNVAFEDNPRLYLGTYSGKMRENVGAGLAIYQQEVGVFKDFGALANYAHRLQLNDNMDLTFGFNFLYSRRSADALKVNSTVPDPQVANFQDIPIINFQPAVTLSFGKFDVGVFFENLVDFNLKSSEMATSFGEKTYSAHAMYSHEFTYASGIFEGADLRVLAIARKPGEGTFSAGGNAILDLPKAGWIKAGYDKTYGISAGLGVNISESLAIGFTYEKSDFAATNEIGLIYNFGKKYFRRDRPTRRGGNVKVTLPTRGPKRQEYDNPEHNDLSDEIQKAQDSIDILNKKVDQILRLLKNQPEPVKVNTPTQANKTDEKDTSLRRRSNKPWRQSTITHVGGGGTMYYIIADRYKNEERVQPLIDKWARLGYEAKSIFDPKSKIYWVYLDRFVKEEDAEEKLEKEFGGGTRFFEKNNDKNDESSIKVKKNSKDGVYIRKLTIGKEGDSYKEPKKQPPARVRTMAKMQGVEPGYYIVVYVNSKKSLADRNVDELRNDNIDAGYFINPATGYMHIYIAKTQDRKEAIRLYESNLDGAFYDRKSIINVK